MAHFNRGEIALYNRLGSPYHGQEVTILSELKTFFFAKDHITGDRDPEATGYQITPLDPTDCTVYAWFAKPCHLKKRKPPAKDREMDQIVPWHDCAWAPSPALLHSRKTAKC